MEYYTRDKSQQITEKVIELKEFLEADKILLYASYRSEVDTSKIFQKAQNLRKDIYYPKVSGKEMYFFKVEKEADLMEGYRGIREPEYQSEDIYVEKVYKLAIAFACQIVETGKIISEQNDLKVDCVVTEELIIGK